MSHSTVLVIVDDPAHKLDSEHAFLTAKKMLEPYDENLEGPERRVYEEGGPKDHWMYSEFLGKGVITEDVGWQEFVEAFNAKYGHEDLLYYDAELETAYTITTYNEQSRWDWYVLGGRWRGFYPVKAGVMAASQLGQPGVFDDDEKLAPNVADLVRKGDVDWDFMDREATIAAEATWQKVEEAAKDLSDRDKADYLPWETIRDLYETDEARTRYWSQPVVKAMKDFSGPFDGSPEDYIMIPGGRETFVKRARTNSGLTFAVLDDKGWHEQGRMGWWGMVDKSQTGDIVWSDEFQTILDSHSDDAWLVVMDIHI